MEPAAQQRGYALQNKTEQRPGRTRWPAGRGRCQWPLRPSAARPLLFKQLPFHTAAGLDMLSNHFQAPLPLTADRPRLQLTSDPPLNSRAGHAVQPLWRRAAAAHPAGGAAAAGRRRLARARVGCAGGGVRGLSGGGWTGGAPAARGTSCGRRRAGAGAAPPTHAPPLPPIRPPPCPAAILALGAVSQGCATGLAPYLPELAAMLTPTLADPRPMVRCIRWARPGPALQARSSPAGGVARPRGRRRRWLARCVDVVGAVDGRRATCSRCPTPPPPAQLLGAWPVRQVAAGAGRHRAARRAGQVGARGGGGGAGGARAGPGTGRLPGLCGVGVTCTESGLGAAEHPRPASTPVHTPPLVRPPAGPQRDGWAVRAAAGPQPTRAGKRAATGGWRCFVACAPLAALAARDASVRAHAAALGTKCRRAPPARPLRW